MPFELVRNDITRMRVDAIVNAANCSLLGGGGVDGAIHRAAGPGLLRECAGLGGCPTGEAKITGGYDLPCRYVIHTPGPVWQGGGQGEKELLASCYLSSLRLAAEHGCETVAFPLISAGAYGYPRDQALRVAADTILDFLVTHDMRVYLVIYGGPSAVIGQKRYAGIRAFIDGAAIPDGRFREESPRREAGAAPAAGPDEGFRDMLLRKIGELAISDAACCKRANVDRKLFDTIKNQPDYRPEKTTVLAFAAALRLPLPEMREMLDKAGFSLSHSSKADLIVEYFVGRGCYDVFEINEALFSFGQKLLGSP